MKNKHEVKKEMSQKMNPATHYMNKKGKVVKRSQENLKELRVHNR